MLIFTCWFQLQLQLCINSCKGIYLQLYLVKTQLRYQRNHCLFIIGHKKHRLFSSFYSLFLFFAFFYLSYSSFYEGNFFSLLRVSAIFFLGQCHLYFLLLVSLQCEAISQSLYFSVYLYLGVSLIPLPCVCLSVSKEREELKE